jgi:hypothetical protein
MRVQRVLAALAVAFAALAPAALGATAAAATCTPQVDLWIHLGQPSASKVGGQVTVPITWGVHPLPGFGFDSGTIVNDVRWQVRVGAGLTIKAAAERDPLGTVSVLRDLPATISATTATLELGAGTSPPVKRSGYVTVRVGPSAAGGRPTLRASIGTYIPSKGSTTTLCLRDYRPGDNVSTVALKIAPAPTPTPSRTPTASAPATPTPTATDSASPSDTPSDTPSSSAVAVAAPPPVAPASGGIPTAVVIAGAGGGAAALAAAGTVLVKRRRPPA